MERRYRNAMLCFIACQEIDERPNTPRVLLYPIQ